MIGIRTEVNKGELTGFFSGLSPAVDIASRAQKEMDRWVATKFSIFDYFHERETDLSRVFAGLLTPSGAHGQGDRFLSLFLEEILPLLKETLPEYSLPSDLHKCEVDLEYSTHERRRIDIVLKMPDNNLIGIENKPWAEEQERQVEAYLEFLQSEAKEGGIAWILFLSGDGNDPETLPEDLALRRCCQTVPYRKNSTGGSLENWIKHCWKACEAERVRWFLKDLLEYFQRNFEKENQVMARDVIVETAIDFILANDGKYLDLALQVEKAVPQVREKLIKGVMESAQKRLEKWREKENWTVSPIYGNWLILRKKEWDEKNNLGWDTGVVIVENRLKVHLPDNTDVDNFKVEFEKRIGGERTTKWKYLVEQPYDLSSEENLKRLMKKDEVACELAEKMKYWAKKVDETVEALEMEGEKNSD